MDIAAAINSLANTVTSNVGIASILDSPLYMALTISIIIVIAFNFGMESSRWFKQGFYTFIFMATSLFLYHKRHIKIRTDDAKAESAALGISGTPSIEGADIVRIAPPNMMTIPATYL